MVGSRKIPPKSSFLVSKYYTHLLLLNIRKKNLLRIEFGYDYRGQRALGYILMILVKKDREEVRAWAKSSRLLVYLLGHIVLKIFVATMTTLTTIKHNLD